MRPFGRESECDYVLVYYDVRFRSAMWAFSGRRCCLARANSCWRRASCEEGRKKREWWMLYSNRVKSRGDVLFRLEQPDYPLLYPALPRSSRPTQPCHRLSALFAVSWFIFISAHFCPQNPCKCVRPYTSAQRRKLSTGQLEAHPSSVAVCGVLTRNATRDNTRRQVKA